MRPRYGVRNGSKPDRERTERLAACSGKGGTVKGAVEGAAVEPDSGKGMARSVRLACLSAPAQQSP